jgi:uncharacterized protein (DUF4415 family)
MKKRIDSDDRYTDAPTEIAEALAASEPVEDDFPSPEELARELSRTITIRLDPAVYEWFRQPGPGYQTRINAVLRYYVRTQKAKTGHRETGRAVSVVRKRSSVGGANARKAAAKRKGSAKR